MQVPLELSFRGIEDKDLIEKEVRNQVVKLEKVYQHMNSCRVAIEKTQQHQQTGNPYRVRLDITVPPGHEVVVKKEPTHGNIHDPLIKSVHEAFKSARRKLKEIKEKQRNEVKSHPERQVQAFVAKIFKDDGYGFLETTTGRSIYFHRNAVLHDDFDRLEIGTGVSYTEHMGEEGPQASSIQIIDKPGSRIKDRQRHELPT